MKKKSLSMNQIMILSLTAIVVGILGCAIAFFLRTYQSHHIPVVSKGGTFRRKSPSFAAVW